MSRAPQAYTALLNSAVKCGEAELAADVYVQLRQEGFTLERPVFHTVLEVFLKLGRWDDALGVIADMHAQVLGRLLQLTITLFSIDRLWSHQLSAVRMPLANSETCHATCMLDS